MTSRLDHQTQTVCLTNEVGSTVLVLQLHEAFELRAELNRVLWEETDRPLTTDDL